MQTAKPGKHPDGLGLYLDVDDKGNRRWVYRYSVGARLANKRTELGLGSARDVTLAEAREKAAACRAALRRGDDPRAARHPAKVETFGGVADDLISSMATGWKNPKHRDQWAMTLGDVYCRLIRSKPIADIGVDDVLAVLRPHWTRVPETADRLRARIARVLDAARARGLRSGDNPARWRGNLDHLLPARQTLSRRHHAAMPWGDVPAFVQELQRRHAMGARCLEFTILTACRSGESRAAQWGEFDLSARIWTVPPERMKHKRPHRVPLTDRVIDLLDLLRGTHEQWLFPGTSGCISDMTMLKMVRDKGLTVHGFRSSFRDWVGEATTFPEELAEHQLAHTIASKTERAYRRGDALERRRELMTAWERYCLGNTEAVALRVTR